MRPFKKFAALALLLAAASPASADIALPDRTRAGADRPREVRVDLPFSRMSIERVDGLREARLQIPRAQLESLNVAAGLERGAAPGAQTGTFKGLGTVVAGLFLSLAVVLTGLLLVRSRGRGLRVGRAAAALLACAGLAGLAAVAAYANIAPPAGYRVQNPGTLVEAVSSKSLAGSIRIEVVEDGREIKLLIPARRQKGQGEEEE